jgi:hypothetical protein
MTKPPLADVPIRSADDLTRRWTTLLDPPVFGARSLWLTWVDDDGLMLPIVVPIDDLPDRPETGLMSGLLRLHDTVAGEHVHGDGHLAMALCRPGRPEVTEDDDAWAASLQLHLGDRIDGTWSLHLAAAGTVTPLVGAPPFVWRRHPDQA